MQIVIEVDDDLYTRLFDNGGDNYDDAANMAKAIRKGKMLPKGHGRILDEKEILDTEKHDGGWYDLVDLPDYIAGVPGIVEAESEEDKQ